MVWLLLLLVTAVAAVPVAITTQHGVSMLTFSNESVPLWYAARDTGVIFHCAHRRYETVRDVLIYLDENGDRCLDLPEMTLAFSDCLSWYERVGMRFGRLLGVVETPETTLAACDTNGDGRLCIDDLRATQAVCEQYSAGIQFPSTCLCNCESMAQLYHYVLRREPCV